jgi:coproporphyrinogen III oxidase
MSDIAQKQAQAQAWFRQLRDQICIEFERLEAEHAIEGTRGGPRARPRSEGGEAPVRFANKRSEALQSNAERGGATPPSVSDSEPKAFSFTPWVRENGGGGEMGMMKGDIFEKVGVNISTVHGEFSEQFRAEIPGAKEDPRFWASGISLVAHMKNPHVPAVHMNTRMVIVGGDDSLSRWERDGVRAGQEASPIPIASPHPNPLPMGEGMRIWFGGGADLNPAILYAEDTAHFHTELKKPCDATDPAYYEKFRAWCDDYFFIKHRNCARGVGGIFYDYLDTDWDKHFAFTQSVGRAFLSAYIPLVERRKATPYTDADKHTQLIHRGRYAEFNLLYDRGTRFGLMTGGNPEAILMSLPPLAAWD